MAPLRAQVELLLDEFELELLELLFDEFELELLELLFDEFELELLELLLDVPGRGSSHAYGEHAVLPTMAAAPSAAKSRVFREDDISVYLLSGVTATVAARHERGVRRS